MPPILYIKNTLRLAENGLGDGTVYASATGATPNQAQRTFALSTFTLITDNGADSDDKFNSYILYFPASGNKYHIVDWVASTDTATVWETPATTDTGACEIRRALVDVKALAGNPVKHLADGQKYAVWKSAYNATIDIHLPNFIDNGGFESGFMAPWLKASVGGTADTTGVNLTTPILGSADLMIDLGDRSSLYVEQGIKYPLIKGRAYRLIVKCRTSGTWPVGDIKITVENRAAFLPLNVTFSNPSSGTVSTTEWSPGFTVAEGWHSVDLTPTDHDILTGSKLRLETFSALDAWVDEIYLFEQVNVSSLVIFDPGLLIRITSLMGRRTASDRTGYTVAVEDQELMPSTNLPDAAVSLTDFTPAIFPIYSIVSSTFQEASEILLCEKWSMPFDPILPFKPNQIKYKETVFQARSGVEHAIRHFKQRVRRGMFEALSDAELLRYQNDWLPHHRDEEKHPFAVQWEAGQSPMLMIDDSKESGEFYNTLLPDLQFNFKEVMG